MLILLMIRQCIIWESGDINVGKESLGHGIDGLIFCSCDGWGWGGGSGNVDVGAGAGGRASSATDDRQTVRQMLPPSLDLKTVEKQSNKRRIPVNNYFVSFVLFCIVRLAVVFYYSYVRL